MTAIPIVGGFGDVEAASGYEPLDPGTYLARITDGEKMETKAENVKRQKWEENHPGEEHPGYIKWEFTIEDPDHPEYEGRHVWTNTGLVQESLPFLKSFLLATGYSEDELANPDFNLDIDRCLEQRVKVKVGKQKKKDSEGRIIEGEFNNNVREVMGLEGEASLLP